jgi:hypothetical protein
MTKLIIVVACCAFVAIVGIGFFLFSMNGCGLKPADIRDRMNPKILFKPNTKVLTVRAVGEPNKTVGPAFGLLFKTYYKIKNAPKGRKMEAPRARWPKPLSSPRNEWIGLYAIPVPSSVTALPRMSPKNDLQVDIGEWHYGEVAEILHVGPYAKEVPTVEKLKEFIIQNNYEICGHHEEEYLKGPGFFPTDQEKYLTIIRYQVKKRNTGTTTQPN